MATVLISGGSGLIGKYLCPKLMEKGYNVSVLSRNNISVPGVQVYKWEPEKKEIENGAVETADYIIHLAGENIGEKRWTRARKKLIINSRTDTADLIFSRVKLNAGIRAFISASAIGYYGTSADDKIFDESDPPGDDFLAQTCYKWEQAADHFVDSGIRAVKIRTGVVLTDKGGALERMATPVRLLGGAAIGKGNQYTPWIHIEDLCRIYIKAIEEDSMIGPYNAVAPEHKMNVDFMKTLARVLNRPFWFAGVPAFALNLIFGEMAETILKGNRVSDDKIKNTGFQFKFPHLEPALRDLLKKK